MNPDRLLEHFERISEAPDAIPRLRRFILNLAVHGKLVKQDSHDEPASQLLNWVRAEKVFGDDTTKKRAAFDLIDNSTPPFPSPAGWLWVRFGLLHDLIRGVTYTKSDVSETETRDHLPILRANNIGTSLNFDELVFVRKERISSVQMLRRGDYLIALSSGSKNLVGKAAFVSSDHTAGFGGFCGVIRISFQALQPFVGVFLASPFYRDAISEGSRGIGINNLKKATLGNILFPLPPLAEQHRIVAKVDELMALCDQLEAAREVRERRRDRLAAASLHRLNQPADAGDASAFREHARFHLAHLPRLTTRPDQVPAMRQTILNLAVRGKLVPQDPNDEPASELLKRIAAEKGTAKLKQRDLLPESDLSEVPFELPSGWAWARFPELGLFGRGRSKHRPRNDPSLFEDGIHPFVQTGDVARSRGVIETFTAEYNHVGLAQSAKWPKGTLCITIAANIADSGILGFDACFPDSVVGLVPAPMFPNARYFEYFMRTAKSDLLAYAPATAQKNINLGILNSLLIPLPPVAEQHRILARVDGLMGVCDHLETQLTTARTQSRRLLEALLDEALSA